MKHSSLPIQDIQKIICKDFQLEQLSELKSIEEVKIKLTEIISFLLNNDMNRLLNIFYRIDLSENKVDEILSTSAMEEISTKLAELVLNREIEKVKTRLKYKGF